MNHSVSCNIYYLHYNGAIDVLKVLRLIVPATGAGLGLVSLLICVPLAVVILQLAISPHHQWHSLGQALIGAQQAVMLVDVTWETIIHHEAAEAAAVVVVVISYNKEIYKQHRKGQNIK